MAWPAIFDAAVDVARLNTLYLPADATAGSKMHKQSYPAPDWAHWLARNLWRLDQAVALSLGIDPLMVDGDRVRMPGMDSRQLLGDVVHVPGKLLVLEPLPDEYFERLGIAQSCAGMSLPVRDGRPGSEHVEPTQFVAWARGKGFALPRELDHLAAGEPTSRARTAPPTPKPAAGRAGRKPGSGSINDEPALARMLMLLAEGRAPASVNARVPPVALSDASGQPIVGEKAGKQIKMPASTWLDQNRPVEQMTWAPGFPLLIRGQLVAEGGWFPRKGSAA